MSLYWDPRILQLYLDGVQFAAGDLDAPAEPRGDHPIRKGPGPTPPEVREAKLKANKIPVPTAEDLKKIEAAAPDQPFAKPAKPRHLLVWGHSWTHNPNVFCEEAIQILGKKTGAFEATVTDDPRTLLGDALPRYDALVLSNIHEPEPFLPPDFAQLTPEQQQAAKKCDAAIKQSILEYVRGEKQRDGRVLPGHGLVGTHASTAALGGWREYGDMIGGYYGNHFVGDAVLKAEEPQHPLVAFLKGEPWKINEEFYIFREPYDRAKLRVLLSLDLAQMPDPGKRPDKDYAVSWIRKAGDGRVFYTVLGHSEATHWNPLFLRHLLAGIQFALGDLEAPSGPR